MQASPNISKYLGDALTVTVRPPPHLIRFCNLELSTNKYLTNINQIFPQYPPNIKQIFILFHFSLTTSGRDLSRSLPSTPRAWRTSCRGTSGSPLGCWIRWGFFTNIQNRYITYYLNNEPLGFWIQEGKLWKLFLFFFRQTMETTSSIWTPWGSWAGGWSILLITISIFLYTRPKPAYGRQGLDWIIGPGYSFVVFSTNRGI